MQALKKSGRAHTHGIVEDMYARTSTPLHTSGSNPHHSLTIHQDLKIAISMIWIGVFIQRVWHHTTDQCLGPVLLAHQRKEVS